MRDIKNSFDIPWKVLHNTFKILALSRLPMELRKKKNLSYEKWAWKRLNHRYAQRSLRVGIKNQSEIIIDKPIAQQFRADLLRINRKYRAR